MEKTYQAYQTYQADIIVFQFEIYNQTKKHISHARNLHNHYLRNQAISPRDIKQNIFQLINPSSWNKLFSMTLIKNNKIKFIDHRPIDDLGFTFLSICLAKKIVMIDDILIKYRVGDKTSQTGKMKLPDFKPLKAYDTLKKQLQEKSLFNQFSKSFYLAKLESFLWLIKISFFNSL